MAANQMGHTPRLIDVHGHRGAAGLAPENTLAAFRKAITLGVDALEMDLHITRDGQVVVIHDETLDRTTDGRGSIADLTLEEIRRRDAGRKFASSFQGEWVPTLREVIELVRASGNTRLRMDLEIKFGEGQEGKPDDFEERVLGVLRQAGFLERVNVISFHHPSLTKVKALEPTIRTGLLQGDREPHQDAVGLVRQYQANYYSPRYQQVTAELVAALHRAGIPIVPWTVNEEKDMRRLMALGIGTLAGDGIATDFPDRLLNLLRAHR
ncbi:MAG TPA: glycerophosphodiester phosphodiesterase family protein [Candidatus Acidoferrum sp.]|nr:glycerophosphodiester phosphodiesterase family protein [Candidatus Acidoferrum sp.]